MIWILHYTWRQVQMFAHKCNLTSADKYRFWLIHCHPASEDKYRRWLIGSNSVPYTSLKVKTSTNVGSLAQTVSLILPCNWRQVPMLAHWLSVPHTSLQVKKKYRCWLIQCHHASVDKYRCWLKQCQSCGICFWSRNVVRVQREQGTREQRWAPEMNEDEVLTVGDKYF